MFQYELLEDTAFDCRFTGTNCIKHYMIPVKNLTEITDLEVPVAEEVEPEPEVED